MSLFSDLFFAAKAFRQARGFALGLVVFGVASAAQAQSPGVATAKPPASSVVVPANVPAKPAAVPSVSKPSWAELSALQQQTLKPLAASWNGISEPQKRKWLEVSKNYSKLSPAEQTTMHSRMMEWVAMSPQDRATARLNFAKTKELSKELTGEEKKAKWETYQALSPEEKAKLVAKASPKPAGAATAVKPVPVQKLAVTPKGVSALPGLPTSNPVTTANGSALSAPAVPAN